MKIPKYQLLKNDLMNQIRSGTFLPGDRFYSENELKKKYKYSTITVVKALQELTQEGYLVRYQGKGTYVSKITHGQMVRFFEKDYTMYEEEFVKVVSIEKVVNEEINKKLKHQGEVYKIVRVRKGDGVPFTLQNTYILPEYIDHSLLSDMTNFESIYDIVKSSTGISFFTADYEQSIEVKLPPDAETVKLLEVSATEPVILTKRKTFLAEGKTVEYIESYKRWDFFKITLTTV